MSEARTEVVAEHIRARLATILAGAPAADSLVGYVFNYTPEEVTFVEDLNVGNLPRTRQCLYWMLHGDDFPKVATNHKNSNETELFVLAAYRWPTTPFATKEKTVRTRMAGDIQAKLREAATYGDLGSQAASVTHAEVVMVDHGFRIDDSVKWVVCELKLRIHHEGLK